MENSIQKVEGLKIAVFDLDYTLWPFWVDTHVTPPFRKKDGKVFDCHNNEVKYFPQVPTVLEQFHSLGVKIGIASRTSCIDEANALIKLFDWDKFIEYKEIYPGSKTTHINKILKDSGTNSNEIIFFDDEHRNIDDLKRLKVCSILVKNGIDLKTVQSGLEQFITSTK